MSELTIYSPLISALLASCIAWLMTTLGASLVILTHRTPPLLLDALLAFGAGVMLASSYWSLLSPAIELAEELSQPAWLIAAAGFLLGGGALLLTDRVMERFLPFAQATGKRRAILLVSSVTLHNIPEGLAIGVTFGALTSLSPPAAVAAAWALAIGIALQNLPEGAAVSLPLRREGMGRGRAFFFGQLSGFVEPLSAVLGCLLAVTVQGILPFALAFAAGAMVVVVISELIPECQRSGAPLWMTLATLLGFTVMMMLDVGLG